MFAKPRQITCSIELQNPSGQKRRRPRRRRKASHKPKPNAKVSMRRVRAAAV